MDVSFFVFYFFLINLLNTLVFFFLFTPYMSRSDVASIQILTLLLHTSINISTNLNLMLLLYF